MRQLFACFLVLTAFLTSSLLLYHFECLESPAVFSPLDSAEYWSAGRLFVAGANPYDGVAATEVQKPTFFRSGQLPVMMWNPPWTLPFCVITSWMNWRLSQIFWVSLNLLFVMYSSVLLWNVYSGKPKDSVIPIVLGIGFAPSLLLMVTGQISGFLLLGLAGFLTHIRANRWPLAGVFASLAAIKPHLFLPFAMILLIEAFRDSRCRKLVLTGAVFLAIFGSVPLLINAEIWQDYIRATSASSAESHTTLRNWIHPTLGCFVRLCWPENPFWTMFVPLMLGLPVIFRYYWTRRRLWDWNEQLPKLILWSLILAPYGCWVFDVVVIVVPMIKIAAGVSRSNGSRTSWLIVVFFLTLNLLVVLSSIILFY